MLKNNFEINISDEAEVHNQATAIQIKVLQRARERNYLTKEGLLEWASNKQLAGQVRAWIEENLKLGNYVDETEMAEDCLKIFFQPPNKNGLYKTGF